MLYPKIFVCTMKIKLTQNIQFQPIFKDLSKSEISTMDPGKTGRYYTQFQWNSHTILHPFTHITHPKEDPIHSKYFTIPMLTTYFNSCCFKDNTTIICIMWRDLHYLMHLIPPDGVKQFHVSLTELQRNSTQNGQRANKSANFSYSRLTSARFTFTCSYFSFSFFIFFFFFFSFRCVILLWWLTKTFSRISHSPLKIIQLPALQRKEHHYKTKKLLKWSLNVTGLYPVLSLISPFADLTKITPVWQNGTYQT